MRVRIVSDGTGMNTQVENADTGEVLENVVAVSWHADVHGVTALLRLDGLAIDVVGETDDQATCEFCGMAVVRCHQYQSGERTGLAVCCEDCTCGEAAP